MMLKPWRRGFRGHGREPGALVLKGEKRCSPQQERGEMPLWLSNLDISTSQKPNAKGTARGRGETMFKMSSVVNEDEEERTVAPR